MYSNTLINETSPYLLQHAHHLVQWYPWGETALTLAKQQHKPILLSIGYSACHWCHVMAHESFADPKTAEVMNELFINIKVDREERPDLDKIYQATHHLLTQRSGGWPLTMFLDPESHYPFFGGTYFPPQPRYGLPAFIDLLRQVATFFHTHHDQVMQRSLLLADILQDSLMALSGIPQPLTEGPLISTRSQLAQFFDARHGGFGNAPKFLHLPNLEWLLHHYVMSIQQGHPDEEGILMVLLTLKKMALGGIYDQVGGGFYRYSVDEQWMIPHFEKMLYDNGQFLAIYSQAWQLLQTHTSSQAEALGDLFKRLTIETATWAQREMQSSKGAFYSSLDADCEGEEGKFYVWTKEKVKTLLNGHFYSMLAYHFGLTCAPNFEGQYWHFHVQRERPEVANKYELPLAEVAVHLDQARAILFNARQERGCPTPDLKILTAWNALMIKGLATAGRIFGRQDFLTAAEQALDFIKNTLWVNGTLQATHSRTPLNAYLDDYAFLLDAIMVLLQARWRDGDLTFAIQLAEGLLEEFEDVEKGGFYFTGNHHRPLIVRTKSFADDMLPSGNGIAALALGRLGHWLGETRYLKAAERTLQAGWASMNQEAHNHCTMSLALADCLFPPRLIILRGEPEILKVWQLCCQRKYAPQQVCLAIPNEVRELPGLLAEKRPQGEIVAYVCTGLQCNKPLTSLEELQVALVG